MTSKYTLEGKLFLLLGLLLTPTSFSHAHSGLTTRIAWEACDDKPRSESCEYKNAQGDLYIGNCQLMSSHMLCVRNKPIVKSKTKVEHKEHEHAAGVDHKHLETKVEAEKKQPVVKADKIEVKTDVQVDIKKTATEVELKEALDTPKN